MRRKAARVLALVILPLLMTAASCGGGDTVNLIFHQAPGDCAAADSSTAMVRCDNGTFSFNGSVVTPDPCYYLKADVNYVNESSIVIGINTESALVQNGSCIECVGGISFNGTLKLSGACSRTLSIVYNGAAIAEYESE